MIDTNHLISRNGKYVYISTDGQPLHQDNRVAGKFVIANCIKCRIFKNHLTKYQLNKKINNRVLLCLLFRARMKQLIPIIDKRNRSIANSLANSYMLVYDNLEHGKVIRHAWTLVFLAIKLTRIAFAKYKKLATAYNDQRLNSVWKAVSAKDEKQNGKSAYKIHINHMKIMFKQLFGNSFKA